MLDKLKLFVTSSDGNYASSRMTEQYFLKNNPSLLQFVKDSTNFYDDGEITFSKRVMLALYGYKDKIVCTCGNPVSLDRRGEIGSAFRTYCSLKCSGGANKGRKITRSEEEKERINKNRSETMLSKYGVAYNSQREEIKTLVYEKIRKFHNHIKYDILDDKDTMLEMYKTLTSVEIGELCNCDYSVVLTYLRNYGVEKFNDHTKVSKPQREIFDFIASLGVEVLMNERILDGKDIDVFCPSLKVGIEYNGFPFHLENFGNRTNYHKEKTTLSNSLGIRLIHIFPHDWSNKNDIVKSIISNALGKFQTKLYARKCIVKEIAPKESAEFLQRNHLKGSCSAKYHIGLFFNDILVHVMSFGPSRFDKTYTYELIRSASLINHSIVGGVSKCMKYFVRTRCVLGNTIASYADRSISEGKSYEAIGFKFVKSTSQGYHYTKQNGGTFEVFSRYKFQKWKLKSYEQYDESKTEWEIMKSMGYDRYWDSGNNLYVLTL
jgi:hypothetical protein